MRARQTLWLWVLAACSDDDAEPESCHDGGCEITHAGTAAPSPAGRIADGTGGSAGATGATQPNRAGETAPAPDPIDAGPEDDSELDSGAPDYVIRQHVISPAMLYSAYDGSHDYLIAPWVPLSAASTDPSLHPLLADTLSWQVDPAFIDDLGPFPELPGGRLLRTRKPGSTLLQVTGITDQGVPVRGQVALLISAADSDTWNQGDDRYNTGVNMDWSTALADCALPVSPLNSLPATNACGDCHHTNSAIAAQPTPAQTARYSDSSLIALFSMAAKPAGGKFASPFLSRLPAEQAECLYGHFHTWEIPQDVLQGLVWKLRSIPPRAPAENTP